MEDAKVLNTGIGGTAALMQIDDTPIFVKMVPLTELERHNECHVYKEYVQSPSLLPLWHRFTRWWCVA